MEIRYEPIDEAQEASEEITYLEASVRAVDEIIDSQTYSVSEIQSLHVCRSLESLRLSYHWHSRDHCCGFANNFEE